MPISELGKIEIAVDIFAAKMKEKLLRKYRQGFRGWDDPQNIALLRSEFLTHATKASDPEGFVDVANIAMMIERCPSGFWETDIGTGARAWRELKDELNSWIDTDEPGAESQAAVMFVRDSVMPKIEEKYFTTMREEKRGPRGETLLTEEEAEELMRS